MREFLFRGKAKFDNEWYEGWYAPPYEYKWPRGEEKLRWSDPVIEFVRSDFIPDYVVVDKETVSQYTGWKDKHGKKIFEGDICRFKEWRKGKACWIGKVFFEHGIYIIEGGPNEECEIPFSLQMSRLDISEMEVIGNIHDNPELIGGTE